MAHSRVEDMRDVLQTRKGNLSILNTELETADKGWSIKYVRTGVETSPCVTQQVRPALKESLRVLCACRD
jgi:hypothetical protein